MNMFHIRGTCKPPTDTAAQGPQTYRIFTSAVGCFRLDSVLLTEGSILDRCYKIWQQLQYYSNNLLFSSTFNFELIVICILDKAINKSLI